jgi:transposase InsO family protein
VTAHPSAAWTLQQLREVVGFDSACRYLIHDRDSLFARSLDESIGNLGLTVLKSPPHSPKANAICERLIGTIRRECLDWLIPLSESHLRSILKAWVGHYNHGRPHMALGPGVPDPPITGRAVCDTTNPPSDRRARRRDRVNAEHRGGECADLRMLESSNRDWTHWAHIWFVAADDNAVGTSL